MATATVKVRYVNPPKDGRDYGSIKGENDVYYGVHQSKLSSYKPGGTYTIEYKTSEKGYHTVTKLISGGGSTSSGGVADQPKELAIFVTGIVGRYLGSGGAPFPGEQELTDMVRAAKNAWEKGMASNVKPATPQPEESTESFLDDEIPF